MQLKTSEFKSLFSDGLNGLAGEKQLWDACCDCVVALTPVRLPPRAVCEAPA